MGDEGSGGYAPMAEARWTSSAFEPCLAFVGLTDFSQDEKTL
jgi:hypothetical protein